MKQPILLVEDNPDDAMLTVMAFQESRIANPLVHVSDGESALDYLFRRGEYAHLSIDDLPVFILLDLSLPKIDGHEVLAQMRADATLRRVPVVVMTTSREDVDLVTAYDAGANGYVRKPVDFLEFTDVIRQIGAYWVLANESEPR